MSIKIKDPVLGRYHIEQDHQGIKIYADNKIIVKVNSLEQAYKDIAHRLLLDEDKDMTLLEYNTRAIEIAQNIVKAQKPKEEE